ELSEDRGAGQPTPSSMFNRRGGLGMVLGLLALIIWIALIGIFAIEQIKVRDGILRGIVAWEAEIASRIALLPPGAPNQEREFLEADAAELRGIKQRLTTLILTGSMTTEGALPDIQCDLVRLREGAIRRVAGIDARLQAAADVKCWTR